MADADFGDFGDLVEMMNMKLKFMKTAVHSTT